jgi:iron complex outermembrane receptor protein
MIDGRSIYSSLHSGVYWNRYDTMLDDIARIEVVSGPGGTLWGANAVNGIINIITKSSRDTQGGFLKIDGGSLDAMASARYGGQINDDLTYRFYVKGIRHGSMDTATGANAGDGYHTVQGGFRSDWERGGDDVTVQGDLLGGDSNTSGQTTQSGGNMLARWRHDGENSSTSAQVYYDAVKAASPGVDEVVRTYDVDVQHNHAFGAHEIVIGGGYRSVADKFTNVLNPFVFADPHRTTDLENLYAQDTVALTDALHVIGGVKFEHNDFTGWEIMPNARVSWQPVANQLLWASISRSVRTPSRIDRELQALPLLVPATTFRSEQLLAYEAGYRTQPSPRFSWSVSTYYNVYQDIRDTGFAPGGGLPIQFANNYHGHIYGVETWASFAVTPWWQLEAGLNTMHKDLVLKPGHISTSVDQSLGNDPDYDASLRSAMTFETVNLDVRLHFADALPSPIVPAYTELSARIAWRPSDRLELAIDGQNLLHDHHAETGLPTIRAEIPRSVSGTVTWSF